MAQAVFHQLIEWPLFQQFPSSHKRNAFFNLRSLNRNTAILVWLPWPYWAQLIWSWFSQTFINIFWIIILTLEVGGRDGETPSGTISLNDCFIKSGRSANGKGHYWAIHPANMEDFRKGDFRRRKAQRKVRKHMGLSVDDASTDSPSPPPLDLTTPPHRVPSLLCNYLPWVIHTTSTISANSLTGAQHLVWRIIPHQIQPC